MKTNVSRLLKVTAVAVNALIFSWVLQYVLFGKPFFLGSMAFFVFVALIRFPKAKWVVNSLGVVCALLVPVAKVINDGLMQWAAVEVLLTTNFDEAVGFHEVLPTKLILIGLAFLAVFMLMALVQRKIRFSLSGKTARALNAALVLSVALVCVFGGKTVSQRTGEMYEAYTELTSHKELAEPDWQVSVSGKHDYENYVVVIGESMRSDFMSLYGFPLKTTPLIDAFNAKIIDDFIAPSPYTIVSLPRMLSVVDEDGKPHANNNVVNLAKAAGFKTHWISAQGYSGVWNVGVAEISQYADSKFYTAVPNDFLLLPRIQEALNEDGDKVIFVHLIGSHENPCSKLGDYPNKYYLNRGGRWTAISVPITVPMRSSLPSGTC